MPRLGRTDLTISNVIFGCMRLGPMMSEIERARVFGAALDAGITTFDTAPLYDLGGSERMLGRALRARRDGAVVMTKVGLRWDDPRGQPSFPVVDAAGVTRWVHKNSRPDSVRLEVERSLERLGVERLDLVQIHQRDEETPLDETLGALLDLRRAGKVRAIGVSNFTPGDLERARRALGEVPLASVSPRLNLLERDAELGVLPFAREHAVAVLAYSPLRQGLLAGTIDAARAFPAGDSRHGLEAFSAERRAAVNAALARVAGPIAERHRASIARVALAWVLHQAGVTAVIVGASSPAQIGEIAQAGTLRLSGFEVLALREAFEAIAPRAQPPGALGRLKRRLSAMRRPRAISGV